MLVLALNYGSSSLKYQLIETARQQRLARGLVERIGLADPVLRRRTNDGPEEQLAVAARDHYEATDAMYGALIGEGKALRGASQIEAVGHRVVHGGERFTRPTIVTPDVLAVLERYSYLAPLHNPSNILGIRAAQRLLPAVPQVAIFDTAFHQTMHETAFLYAVPYEIYRDHGFRRYGFHGISFQYLARTLDRLMGTQAHEARVVALHLGSGSSATAMRGGKSVDTSLGFGTTEGLVMGTRPGDLDPNFVLFASEQLGLPLAQVFDMLYKRSGLLGLSGISSDMRDIETAMDQGNQRARLTFEVCMHRIRRYVGALTASLGGLDAVVFTAGIGENDWRVREAVCFGLGYLGVHLDRERNRAVRARLADISASDAAVRVYVIPTDEEMEIALETEELLGEPGAEERRL